jgi:hypothetical protein
MSKPDSSGNGQRPLRSTLCGSSNSPSTWRDTNPTGTNMKHSHHKPLRFRIIALLSLIAFCFSHFQNLKATSTSWPTQWSFECLEDESSEWWHSLKVQTVPGVLYRLQVSESMAGGTWTNLEELYGFGSEWICPLMAGSPPAAPPSGQQPIPTAPAVTVRLAYLIMEKAEGGGIVLSWSSLEDRSPKRMHLPGVTFDPIWEEFDSHYLHSHGHFFFALSPQPQRTVTFTGANPTLGTTDAAMIAEFTNSLPAITANAANSVTTAAQYSHQQQPVGQRKFYRIAADWSLDSDGDGRFDWQELIFDGNNPFTSDTDGDGTPDQAPGTGGTTSGGYPVPTDPEPVAPFAAIEQQTIVVGREYASWIEANDGISVFPQYAVTGMDTAQF